MITIQGKTAAIPWRGTLGLLMRELSRLPIRRRRYVDIRELSPHLQRDMGFLDGNDPRGPRK